MNPKVILVPYSGHNQDHSAIEYAFNLAIAFGAHVEVWHIYPDPATFFTPYMVYDLPIYPEEMYAQMAKFNESNKKAAKGRYDALIEKMKIIHIDNPADACGASASFHNYTGHIGEIISVRARVADMIVMARPPKIMEDNVSAVTTILFHSGRPIIFIPPGEIVGKLCGNTLIAWNGSAEVARAVKYALPFLTRGKVSILTVQDKETKKEPLNAKDLQIFLGHHKIDAEIIEEDIKESSVPAMIVNTSKTLGAEMIVMGAYTHSRTREFFLGGVTKYMLEHADIPVFMAH